MNSGNTSFSWAISIYDTDISMKGINRTNQIVYVTIILVISVDVAFVVVY